MLQNTSAALAALSAALAAFGMLCAALLCFFLFSSLASLDSAISPQLDLAISAASDFQSVASSASQSAESATGAINALSGALASYADSSKDVGDSLSAVAAIPPFSLDSRFSSAASSLRASSVQFANASAQMNETAWGAAGATGALKKSSEDLASAKGSLEGAKFFFKSAIGSLQLASIALFLALEALFSSVLLVSVSVLLTHYPRLFAQKKENENAARSAGKGQSREPTVASEDVPARKKK